MRGFSKAVVVGNLTRDPEIRTISSGTNVCSFSIAVNRSYRAADGQTREEVSFIDCVAWGKLGETIAQYARKGNGLLASGRLAQRSFDGKDGVRRSRTEVVVEDFNFISSGPRQESFSSGSDNLGFGSNFDPNSVFGASIPTIAPAPAPAPTSAPAQTAPNAPDVSGFSNEIPEDIPEHDVDASEIPF